MLVIDNEVLADLISVNLISFLDAETIKTKTAKEAFNQTNLLSEVQLVICTNEIDQENTATLLQNYIKNNNLKTKLIILDGPKTLENDFTYIISNIERNWEEVITLAASIFKISKNILEQKAIPDYIPVPLSYFFNVDSVDCDIFVKIKKAPIEYQLVKRFHRNEQITKETINHYKDLGLESLYIHKDQHKNFVSSVSNNLVEKLETQTLEISKRLELMGDSFEVVHKEIINLGFTSEVVKLSETVIHKMISNVEHFPELNHLLYKIINAQAPLAFQYSHMTSAIATECLKRLGISTPGAILTLTLSSFFHDISLIDHFALSRINSHKELSEANLTNEEIGIVNHHAHLAARIVSRYPNIPNLVEKIIKEHHGRVDGIGFSKDIELLDMPSRIFIISRAFVAEVINYKEHKSAPHSISERLYENFPGPDCAKIIHAIEQSHHSKN